MPRLFVGLELPETVKDMLSDLHMPLPGARWVDDDDLHITLCFLGEVGKRTMNAVMDELDLIEATPFDIRITGLKSFGGDRPRSVWADIEGRDDIAALQRKVSRAVQNVGLAPERRKFTPHVTLARFRDGSPERVLRFMEVRGGYPPQDFEIDRFALFSARPGGGGPYIVEATFPLIGRGPSQAGRGPIE